MSRTTFILCLDAADTNGGMKIIRLPHVHAVLLALVGLLAVGSGAAYAATRPSPSPIGTGVVLIETNLAYEGASGAGTGMVLTSNGEVLTNNHVIAGATTIKVVVPKTTHTYTAKVVGYDTSDDVAVLQLQKGSHLKTVSTGNASALKVGARVTAVGNAGGTGALVSAKGTVTGLDKSITASDDNGNAEELTGLIETNAAVRPGDSGGPLFNASGRVVGMDTAANASTGFAAYQGSDAYAIPIGKAQAIAKLIVAGKSSAKVHVGGTAFLGVQVSSPSNYDGGDTAGAMIAGVVSGGPAESAGLVEGDVITAVAGKAVASPKDVGAIVLAQKPGAQIAIDYTDTNGASNTVTVTLGSGPPQ